MDGRADRAGARRGAAAAADWGRQPLATRVAAVRRLAGELRHQKDSMAALITTEMGKPLAEAAAELEKSAVTADYYADQAEAILGDEAVPIDGVDVWISYEPIGLVLAVMPWNFPVWQVMRFAIPSITAGNGVLLKHSPNVTGSALALQQLCVAAGLPEHLLTALVVAEPDVPKVTDWLINDDRIAAVTLTGSNRAGAAVGAAAGRASKKSVLELGGSDAFVVLDDADISAAATAAVKARYHNAGQSCVCSKRFIVAASVAEEFTDLFVKGAQDLVVGDPTDPRTDVGPMARDDLRASLHRQVQESVAGGAVLLAGGQSQRQRRLLLPAHRAGEHRPRRCCLRRGDLRPSRGDRCCRQRRRRCPTGQRHPVWALAEPLDRRYGPRDPGRQADHVRRGIHQCHDCLRRRVPFGGTKKSGYGRELAAAGIREFTNIRTYWTLPAPRVVYAKAAGEVETAMVLQRPIA